MPNRVSPAKKQGDICARLFNLIKEGPYSPAALAAGKERTVIAATSRRIKIYEI